MPRSPHKPRYPLVQVFWVDASSDDAWEDIKSTRSSLTAEVTSTGFLIHEDDQNIRIARSYALNDDDTEGRLTIPRAWITKIKRL